MIAPSQRMSVVKPYVFAKLNKRKDELKATGMDIIALDMGSPDLPPNTEIVVNFETGNLPAGVWQIARIAHNGNVEYLRADGK